MADNEKLLEAARMIQEHCKETKKYDPCPFGRDGVCNGDYECCFTPEYEASVPQGWRIRNSHHWTEIDALMAKALHCAGFEEIKRSRMGSANCMVKEPDGSYFGLPSAFFKSVCVDETVQLSDIITEYEAR